jgi:hypothetical protein
MKRHFIFARPGSTGDMGGNARMLLRWKEYFHGLPLVDWLCDNDDVPSV